VPSRSPRQPTAIRVNQQASTEIVSNRAGRRSEDRRTSSSRGCCDPHYEARPCQLADLVFSHPGCPDGAIPDLGAGRRSEHVPRSPSGLDRVETVVRAHYPDYLAGHIRPCWPNHPKARWELAWLYQVWSVAYQAERTRRETLQTGTTGGFPVSYTGLAQLWTVAARPTCECARCSHYTRLIEHADPGCELATTGG
jgi:hypothetical protein